MLRGVLCTAPGLKCDQPSLLSQLEQLGETTHPLAKEEGKGYPSACQSSQALC